MKKIILLLYIVLSGAIPIQAQRGEYYFDTDPGAGKGIPVAITAITDSYEWTSTISTSSLTVGFHRLYYRFCDDTGRWGLTENNLLYVYSSTPDVHTPTNQAQLAIFEYYFDIDPGAGQGSRITVFGEKDTASVTFNIPTTGLSVGFHKIYIRSGDKNGKWSNSDNKLFYVYDTKAPTLLAPTNFPIVSMEYFFDKDPGISNGISISSISSADSVTVTMPISTSTLALGNHSVNFRVKDTLGRWSQYSTLCFAVEEKVGIKQVENSLDVRAYPNPTSDMIHFTTQKIIESKFRISVYDNIGKMLQSLDQENTPTGVEINLEKFPQGLYFIRIVGNAKNYQLKVIKK